MKFSLVHGEFSADTEDLSFGPERSVEQDTRQFITLFLSHVQVQMCVHHTGLVKVQYGQSGTSDGTSAPRNANQKVSTTPRNGSLMDSADAALDSISGLRQGTCPWRPLEEEWASCSARGL